jgi:hypothetical protein
MMHPSVLVLLYTLTVPCAVEGLPPKERNFACAVLAPGPGLDVGQLEAIYQRPGFETARVGHEAAWQALWAQLQEWAKSLFVTTGAQTYSNVTRVLVLVVALVVGVLLTVRSFRKTVAVDAPLKPVATPNEARDAPGVHLSRAAELVKLSPRESIRESLLAVLSHLDQRHLHRGPQGRTNRELRAELEMPGTPPELVRSVTPLLQWFDAAFYSMKPVSVEDAERFLRDVCAVTGPP